MNYSLFSLSSMAKHFNPFMLDDMISCHWNISLTMDDVKSHHRLSPYNQLCQYIHIVVALDIHIFLDLS